MFQFFTFIKNVKRKAEYCILSKRNGKTDADSMQGGAKNLHLRTEVLIQNQLARPQIQRSANSKD